MYMSLTQNKHTAHFVCRRGRRHRRHRHSAKKGLRRTCDKAITEQPLTQCTYTELGSNVFRMDGTHYPCLRTVFTGRKHDPWTRASFLDTREHGPSRSTGAILNDVVIIFYSQDGCPKWHPCSRPVNTGSVYRQAVYVLSMPFQFSSVRRRWCEQALIKRHPCTHGTPSQTAVTVIRCFTLRVNTIAYLLKTMTSLSRRVSAQYAHHYFTTSH